MTTPEGFDDEALRRLLASTLQPIIEQQQRYAAQIAETVGSAYMDVMRNSGAMDALAAFVEQQTAGINKTMEAFARSALAGITDQLAGTMTVPMVTAQAISHLPAFTTSAAATFTAEATDHLDAVGDSATATVIKPATVADDATVRALMAAWLLLLTLAFGLDMVGQPRPAGLDTTAQMLLGLAAFRAWQLQQQQ